MQYVMVYILRLRHKPHDTHFGIVDSFIHFKNKVVEVAGKVSYEKCPYAYLYVIINLQLRPTKNWQRGEYTKLSKSSDFGL